MAKTIHNMPDWYVPHEARHVLSINRIEYVTDIKNPSQDLMAVIYVPDDAPPFSMGGLSRFLLEKGCTISYGHMEKPDEQVMRVNGYGTADDLVHMLKHDFAEWQKTHAVDTDWTVGLAEDATVERLYVREHSSLSTHNPINHLRQKYGHKTGPMAGIAFNVANAWLLASSLTSMGDGKVDVSRVFSTLLYIASNAVITAYSDQPEEPKHLDVIIHEVIDNLPDEEMKHLLGDNATMVKPFFDHFHHAMRNNPWEVKAIMDTVAGMGMLNSGIKSGNKLVSASAILGAISAVLPLAPPRFKESLIDPQWVRDIGEVTGIAGFLRRTSEQSGGLGSIFKRIRHGIHWLQENSLLVSGITGMMSSVGYMMAGIFGGREKKLDITLIGSGISLIVGNVLKAFSVQKSSYAIGDVTFAATESIIREHEAEGKDIKDINHSNVPLRVAHGLEATDEINQNPKRIQRYIKEMLYSVSHEHEMSIFRPDLFILDAPWSHLRKVENLTHAARPYDAHVPEACKLIGVELKVPQVI